MATITLLGDHFQPYTVEVPDPPPPAPGGNPTDVATYLSPPAANPSLDFDWSDAEFVTQIAGAPPAPAAFDQPTVGAGSPTVDDVLNFAAYAPTAIDTQDTYVSVWFDGQYTTDWTAASSNWATNPIHWDDTGSLALGFWADANGWWYLG